jgi:hypothetical protein
MIVLTSPKAYAALAAFQAGDVVKAASAIGLLSVSRFPALARLTTAMLTLYFVLAVGAHIRAHDKVVNALPAASFLATFAVMTAKGPDRG